MTVIVVALGSAGDVHPNVGLALALSRRGHRVLLVASAVFAPLAKRVGLDFLGLGTERDYYEAVQDPDIWHPHRAFSVIARRLILPSMREVYKIVAQLKESGDIMVVAPGTAFGARIANERLGVALATVHLQPAMLRSGYQAPVFGFPDILGHLPRPLRRLYFRAADRFFIDRLLAPEVNAFRAELGLSPVRRLLDRWAHSPQLILGLFPDWFATPQPDWPPNVHLTGFPLYDESDSRQPPAGLADFLEAGDAPIVFTAGSAMAQGKEFFQVSVEVCRTSGRRGLLLTQFPEQVPLHLPDGVRHFNYVPFSKILPRAAAFVHHGGIGTTSQALAAGISQLVVPLSHDQPDNAVRICRLGVGDILLPKEYKTDTVLRRLHSLLESPVIRENCQQRARDLAVNTSLEKSCALIEQVKRISPGPERSAA
jgi:rhamnosyltransferase subunit B